MIDHEKRAKFWLRIFDIAITTVVISAFANLALLILGVY